MASAVLSGDEGAGTATVSAADVHTLIITVNILQAPDVNDPGVVNAASETQWECRKQDYHYPQWF